MSFAIEVPGEASPLTLTAVQTALRNGISGDVNQIQAASKQLGTWETYHGFLPFLQTIFLDHTQPADLRQLAIILLKNSADKYWRSGGRNALRIDDKDTVRKRLYQGCVEEQEDVLQAANAIVVAKVVRIDWPEHWSTPFEDMLAMIRLYAGNDPTRLAATLVMLLKTAKELSKARLRRHQTALLGVAPDLLRTLRDVFDMYFRSWREQIDVGAEVTPVLEAVMKVTLFALKTMRRLILLGAGEDATKEAVTEIWSQMQAWLEALTMYATNQSLSNYPDGLQTLVGIHALQISKLYVQLASDEPAAFVMLPNSMRIARLFWDYVAGFADRFQSSGGLRRATNGEASSRKTQGPLDERLALQGLLLIKNCIAIAWKPRHTFKYKSNIAKEQEELAIETVKMQLFPNGVVIAMVKIIIGKFLLFRQADLDAWDEDPEEFESSQRQYGDAWEFEVRSCAERIFLDLLLHYKPLLLQPLVAYFQEGVASEPNIITKEALYTALGGAAPNMYQSFDFGSFLRSTLVQDAQLNDPLAKILRRRICILLSSWIPVQMTNDSLPLVYDLFRQFLDPEQPINDLAVRITAARQLKLVADDFNFPSKVFGPFATDILARIMGLLDVVTSDETKEALFETLRICVTRMEADIAPFAQQIMTGLPGLWESADTGSDVSYVSKQAVLAVLSSLITSLGREALQYQDFFLPVVVQSADPSSDDYFILREDIVDLWKSIMEQCSSPLHPSLIQLIPKAFALLEKQADVIDDGLDIVKAYIVLAPEDMLSDQYRSQAIRVLGAAMLELDRGHVLEVVKRLELMIRAAELLYGAQGLKMIAQDMLESSQMQRMVRDIHGVWESRQTTGPRAKKAPVDSVLEKNYFTVIARVAVADISTLIDMLESIAPIDQIWPWFSEQWFACFDVMADLEREKLSCLALTRLCELAPPISNLCLARLQDYLSMWTSLVRQLCLGESATIDPLVWSEAPILVTSTYLERREAEIAASDPVHTVSTFPFIRERFVALVQRAGGEQQFRDQWAANVDKEVMADFVLLLEAQ